jgi:glycosyltransferase involved in cell wall biosynthesis
MTLNQQPLISIAMTTYNGERFLREQLDSILNQDYHNIELVVCDDCSSDNTVKILTEYTQKHYNMRVFVNEKTLGLAKNFEKAISLCKGEYIALSDQDDIWDLQKLTILQKEIGDANLIYSYSDLVDENGVFINKTTKDTRNMLSVSNNCLPYLFFGLIYGHTMLFPKKLLSALLPFPTVAGHDVWVGYIASSTGEVKFIDKPLVKYRLHTSNSSGPIGIKNKQTPKAKNHNKQTMEQVNTFRYNVCNVFLDRLLSIPEKVDAETIEILTKLKTSYTSISFTNRLSRTTLFFKYRKEFLAAKTYGSVRRLAFCFKTLYKIV